MEAIPRRAAYVEAVGGGQLPLPLPLPLPLLLLLLLLLLRVALPASPRLHILSARLEMTGKKLEGVSRNDAVCDRVRQGRRDAAAQRHLS